jgi:hypothetical protein
MGNDAGEKKEIQMRGMVGGDNIPSLQWNILLSEGFKSPE